jgi:hypothetical protein
MAYKRVRGRVGVKPRTNDNWSRSSKKAWQTRKRRAYERMVKARSENPITNLSRNAAKADPPALPGDGSTNTD